jgi:hypothetical protein
MMFFSHLLAFFTTKFRHNYNATPKTLVNTPKLIIIHNDFFGDIQWCSDPKIFVKKPRNRTIGHVHEI